MVHPFMRWETIFRTGRRCLCLLAFALPVFALPACTPVAPASLQGYVEGDYVRVAAPFAGTLTTLAVQRGVTVQPGAPLFVLEQENEAAASREAAQRLAAAQATLANLQKGKRTPEIAAVQDQIRQAQATVALDRQTLLRQQALVRQGFTSRASLDQAQAAFTRDSARVAELKNQLQTAREGARPDEIRAAEAQVHASQAALAQADWRLAQKSVRAPVGALVDDTLYTQGEWVPAGSPVVSLLPPGNIRVRFFVTETGVGRLRRGQQVTVRCDGCAQAIPAVIRYISPQAEYTPPVLYNKDNREKLVFLVEARPAPQDAARLHPGQPVDVFLGH